MKCIAFFCFFIPFISLSQDFRFTYNYRFVSDTLKKDLVTNEIVVLDSYVEERRSVFTGLKHIISDSTMMADVKKGIYSFPDGTMKIRYVVEKMNNVDLINFYTPDNMGDPVFKVTDDRKINWKISAERERVLGYLAQKATTFFGGREWTAWFTPEISIADGPYKFHGLPGLILKISDKTNTHSFEIISVQKQKSNYFILNENDYKKAKQITLKEYEKMPNHLELFKSQALMGDVIFRDKEQEQKFMRDIDIQIKEKKIHDNNPIEILDVLKN